MKQLSNILKILFGFLILFLINIFLYYLIQHNDYLVSIVDADGLVL